MVKSAGDQVVRSQVRFGEERVRKEILNERTRNAIGSKVRKNQLKGLFITQKKQHGKWRRKKLLAFMGCQLNSGIAR